MSILMQTLSTRLGPKCLWIPGVDDLDVRTTLEALGVTSPQAIKYLLSASEGKRKIKQQEGKKQIEDLLKLRLMAWRLRGAARFAAKEISHPNARYIDSLAAFILITDKLVKRIKPTPPGQLSVPGYEFEERPFSSFEWLDFTSRNPSVNEETIYNYAIPQILFEEAKFKLAPRAGRSGLTVHLDPSAFTFGLEHLNSFLEVTHQLLIVEKGLRVLSGLDSNCWFEPEGDLPSWADTYQNLLEVVKAKRTISGFHPDFGEMAEVHSKTLSIWRAGVFDPKSESAKLFLENGQSPFIIPSIDEALLT